MTDIAVRATMLVRRPPAEVTESGFGGDADAAVSYAADSTGGFTIVLCGLKALLEHGVELGAVRDSHPSGLGQ